MSVTELIEETYNNDENECNITGNTSDIPNSIISHCSTNNGSFNFNDQNDIRTYKYNDELVSYSTEARESILKGIKQTETLDRGSFSKYVE